MFVIEGVDEKNFNAIFRRGFLYRMKARFEDPHVLAAAYPDIHKDGVFPKDPDLQAFLTSPPAVAAGLQLQHSFEMEHSKDQCINMIEEYVLGGDGGFTEDVLRAACKLPPKDRRASLTHAGAVINVEVEDEDEKEASMQAWANAHEAVVEFMLIRKKPFAKAGFLKNMKLREGPNVSREGLLDGLRNMKRLFYCPGANKKEGQYMPEILNKHSLEQIIAHRSREPICLPEQHRIDIFSAYMHGNPFRKENAEILAEVLRAWGHRKLQRAGRPSEEEAKQREEMRIRADKFMQAEKLGDQLLDAADAEAQKKRRTDPQQETEVKAEGSAVEASSSERIVAHQIQYHYPTSLPNLRSRKQASGLGAQKFSQRAQMFLCRGTHDLDIQNSFFCLMVQLLEKLALFPCMPEDPWTAMRECAGDRARVCEETLHTSQHAGKSLLVSLFYGGQPAKKWESLDFIHQMQKASIFCRWVAASTCRDEFVKLLDDTSKRNPDVSILAHLYMALEDHVLSHWTEFLTSTFSLSHLSLHFDGVRISDVPGVSVEDICRRSEAYLEKHAGFKVHIREKKHELTLTLMKDRASSRSAATFEPDHPLRKPGNCILHAMAVLEQKGIGDKVLLLSDTSMQENVYMEQRRCRTYEQCVHLWQCKVYPRLARDQDLPEGKFLLHVENGPAPHCVAVERTKAGQSVKVKLWDTDGVFTLTDADFERTLADGVDSSTCVLFTLIKKKRSDLVRGRARALAGFGCCG